MSGAAERLSARAASLPAGSLRRRTIEGAGRFKAAWVELARLLVEVHRGEHWRGWGHASFDRYCTGELFIRRATAEKLLASYGFLERHEPAIAAGTGTTPAPAFELIEVLSRAEQAGRLPPDGWRALREEVMERPPTPAAMARSLDERYGRAPPPPRPPPPERLARLAGAARRLAESCSDDRAIPAEVAARARDLADALDALREGG